MSVNIYVWRCRHKSYIHIHPRNTHTQHMPTNAYNKFTNTAYTTHYIRITDTYEHTTHTYYIVPIYHTLTSHTPYTLHTQHAHTHHTQTYAHAVVYTHLCVKLIWCIFREILIMCIWSHIIRSRAFIFCNLKDSGKVSYGKVILHY